MSAGRDIAMRLGGWAAAVSADTLPAEVRVAALRCILDATGVALAARDRPVVAAARRLARGSGTCNIIGGGAPVDAAGAALANATAIHALDFDDTCYAGTLHGTAVIWPAVLAAAEAVGASGAETVAGFVAGAEVAYALGSEIGNAIYDLGWWTTPLLGTIGAAAGAARVMRLDAAATGQAIAIAAAQAFGPRSVMGSTAKPYLCGVASSAGLGAVLAAREGIAGPREALESVNGLARLTGAPIAAWPFVAGLGSNFALLRPGIAFKRYPVCSSSQAAAEAVAWLLQSYDLASDAVASVHCTLTPMAAQCLPFARPATPGEAQFCLAFAVGCILVHGDLGPSHLVDTTLTDPRLLRAMEAVTMAVDPAMASTPEDRRDRPEACIATLTTRDGRRLIHRIDAATGMPANPASDAMLDAKFLRCAVATLSEWEAQVLHGRLQRLDRLPLIHDLFAPLREDDHA